MPQLPRDNKPRLAVPRERGYWGMGLYHPKKEYNIGTLLRCANAFGAAFVFTIAERFHRQATDTARTWRHVPAYRYESIDDLTEHLPHQCKLVAIETRADGYELPRFAHPEQACYLLGAEDYGLEDHVLARCDFVVRIPGAAFSLNVASAGAIVMYDRYWKHADRPKT